MSIKLILATAIVAAAATLSALGAATAQSVCNGTVRHIGRVTTQCYYLPTVSNGRVTGLQEHLNIHFNRPGIGAVIGQGRSSMPCRYLPTVAGGRVTGTHQVCG
jgi:hypothetical protein